MNLLKYSPIIFVWMSLPVIGQYQLHSPIGSKLSGVHCPDQNITISCNFSGQNSAIGWYIDQDLQAQYDYRPGAQYPMNVPLEHNAVLKAEVQILSASVSDMQFIFVNFTLTATFENLLPFQWSNITCGVITLRSNVFQIQNFTTQVENIRNISYLAKYQGSVGKLEEINIQWIDGHAMCTIITSYMVQLQGNEGLITTRELSTSNCANSQCYVQFNSSDWNKSTMSESYEVIVTVNNRYYNNFTYSNSILNITGNVIILNACNNTALITCSDLFNENCSVSSTAFTGSVIFMPGEENSLIPLVEKAPRDIKIIIQLNSTILEQTVNDNESCLNILIPTVVSSAVVLSILILGTIIFIVVCRCKKEKVKKKKDKKEKFDKVKFGSIPPDSLEETEALTCSYCYQEYDETLWKEENGQKIKYSKPRLKKNTCKSCHKSMCENCFNEVYLKYLNEQNKICNNCDEIYQTEKRKIKGLGLYVGKTKPRKAPHSNICKECSHTKGQEYEKKGTGEVCKAKISACPSCGQWICNECYDGHDVKIEYLNKTKEVCRNCYAIYKMTTDEESEL